MSQISDSIWNQDEKGEWKLYFNNESNISLNSLNKEEKNSKNNDKTNNISDINLMIGKLVMTPKGIGRLIKNIEGISYVRFNQEDEEYKFPNREISNFFNCYIISLKKTFKKEIIRLKLKSEGTVKDIIEELIKIDKVQKDFVNGISLILNKKKLKEENTFEQINLLNNSKILIMESELIEYKVYRFNYCKKYGLLNSYDGICFSVSENIKLSGVGLYCSLNNRKISGYIKIVEGNSTRGEALYSQNVEIPISNQKIISPIYKVSFPKFIFCQKNKDYSIIFYTDNFLDIYCGLEGKIRVEGEKGIVFNFKTINNNIGESNSTYGNFPTIYYYLN